MVRPLPRTAAIIGLVLASNAPLSTRVMALQLSTEGAYHIKVEELSVKGELLVKNSLFTQASITVPRAEVICIKLPSDCEKTSVWTGSHRVDCFNGKFDDTPTTTKPKTQCGTLAKDTVYEVEQRQEGVGFNQTEIALKDDITTITKVSVRP